MGYIYSFEKLDVWQDARAFVKEIYTLIDGYPEKEKYGICSQMQRAVVSVVSNIAEGTSRYSTKEQIRFIEIAYGSLMEVYCQLYISLDLEYISEMDFEKIKIEVNKISNKLNAWRKSLSTKNNSTTQQINNLR